MAALVLRRQPPCLGPAWEASAAAAGPGLAVPAVPGALALAAGGQQVLVIPVAAHAPGGD